MLYDVEMYLMEMLTFTHARFQRRRTIKDFFTFIPFIIILLIPLSPIGHVLVFGAIQRFFPDFFPSCFTEQRQNLLQLYETAEYSEFKINETPDVSTSGLLRRGLVWNEYSHHLLTNILVFCCSKKYLA